MFVLFSPSWAQEGPHQSGRCSCSHCWGSRAAVGTLPNLEVVNSLQMSSSSKVQDVPWQNPRLFWGWEYGNFGSVQLVCCWKQKDCNEKKKLLTSDSIKTTESDWLLRLQEVRARLYTVERRYMFIPSSTDGLLAQFPQSAGSTCLLHYRWHHRDTHRDHCSRWKSLAALVDDAWTLLQQVRQCISSMFHQHTNGNPTWKMHPCASW